MAHYFATQRTEIGKDIRVDGTAALLLQVVALSLGFKTFPCSEYVRPTNPKTGKFTKGIDKSPPPHIQTRLLY